MAVRVNLTSSVKLPTFSGKSTDSWEDSILALETAQLGSDIDENAKKSLILQGLQGLTLTSGGPVSISRSEPKSRKRVDSLSTFRVIATRGMPGKCCWVEWEITVVFRKVYRKMFGSVVLKISTLIIPAATFGAEVCFKDCKFYKMVDSFLSRYWKLVLGIVCSASNYRILAEVNNMCAKCDLSMLLLAIVPVGEPAEC